MGSTATGDIEAQGVTPQADFKAAATTAPAPARPYMTFPVKPDIAKEIASKLDQIQGRTDDSKITTEPMADGGTKFALIDTRDNQPLAVMKTQGDEASLTLYKSPEALAKRIDSTFISANDINEFIKDSRAPAPQATPSMKPGS